MKKLKLQIEALEVETFGIAAAVDGEGTVRGYSDESLFSPEMTCGYSCLEPNTCEGSCFCTGGADC